MMKLAPLIQADPERSSTGIILLPGETNYSHTQIIQAHKNVIPIYDENGNVSHLDVAPEASTSDICAVLASCGIPVAAIADLQELDPLRIPLRYQINQAPEIGVDVITLSATSIPHLSR